MRRFPITLLAAFSLAFTGLVRAQNTEGIHGRLEGRTYISPGGDYRIVVPVLPELGGQISDTQNVAVFQDSFNFHASIGSFPQDPTQRWELSTRGVKDYLPYFFSNFVMPDFLKMYPQSQVESAVFLPGKLGGSMIVYTLLPNGSMFTPEISSLATSNQPIVAKRGNLLFVKNNIVYVISLELAERSLEGSLYHKTPEEENKILRDRLDDILSKMEFRVTD